MDFVIKNASVISMAEDDEIDSNCSIVVRDGIITALGREPINEHPERVIDGTNLVIMPRLSLTCPLCERKCDSIEVCHDHLAQEFIFPALL